MTDASPLPEQYNELSLVADGEYTRTYRARELEVYFPVALKTIRPDRHTDTRAHAWLANEQQVMLHLARTRAIAGRRFRRAFEVEGVSWLVFNWVPGQTLADWLTRHAPVSPDTVLDLARVIATALEDVHRVGIVHGDLSPRNLIIADEWIEQRSAVSLIDFASASKMWSPRASRDDVLCDVRYTAPEVFVGREPTPADDLYSLGVILFRAFVGRVPFEARTPAELLAVSRGDIPWGREFAAAPTLRSLIGTLLAREPNAPRPTVAEFRVAIESARELSDGVALYAEEFHDVATAPTASPIGGAIRNAVTAVFQRFSRSAPNKANPPSVPTGAPGDRPSCSTPAQSPLGGSDLTAVSLAHGVPIRLRRTAHTETFAAADFTIFAPSSVPPGRSFVLELWISRPGDRERLLELASRPGRVADRARRPEEIGVRRAVQAPLDSEISLLLRLDDFELEDDRDTVTWNGEIINVRFVVRVPAGLAAGSYPGQLKILHCGMLVTRVVFDVIVGAGAAPRAERSTHANAVRSAFASYATEDWPEVVRRVHGIQATGIDVFLDVLALRAGEDWEKRLFENILARDIFFLFWSPAAMRSAWVEREWRFALSERGIEFIHPVPLAPPSSAPPPQELASRHFNDLILLCLASQQAVLPRSTLE